jgi:hypothetical protein
MPPLNVLIILFFPAKLEDQGADIFIANQCFTNSKNPEAMKENYIIFGI